MSETKNVFAPAGGAAAAFMSAEDIEKEIKPLSDNGFLAFFQGLWRAWLGVWYSFSDKHPKASGWIYKLVFFLIFSYGVTIWQLLVMLFLPYAFQGMWETAFVWPAVDLGLGGGLSYAIFNEPVVFFSVLDDSAVFANTVEMVEQYLADPNFTRVNPATGFEGPTGLGNFIAFEIAVFTAQCINLPLQRNITFKSKGNIWVQAMWYFIGWVGISIGVNALWGIINPFILYWNWNEFIIGLVKTFITGGISMAVFFPIFLIIFPDLNKVAKKKRAMVEKLKAANAAAQLIADAEAIALFAEEEARVDNARRDEIKGISQANAAAVAFGAANKTYKNAADKFNQLKEASDVPADKLENAEMEAALRLSFVPKYQEKASEAIKAKYVAIEAHKAVVLEVQAARAERPTAK